MAEGSPLKVLMVEDNSEHVELCREYLPADEFYLEAAFTAKEALSKLEDDIYDIVILDYDLPDMDGLELLRQIRIVGINTTIIFVSGYDDPDLSFEALKLGACDYVVKTFQYYAMLKDRILENIKHCRPGGRIGF